MEESGVTGRDGAWTPFPPYCVQYVLHTNKAWHDARYQYQSQSQSQSQYHQPSHQTLSSSQARTKCTNVHVSASIRTPHAASHPPSAKGPPFPADQQRPPISSPSSSHAVIGRGWCVWRRKCNRDGTQATASKTYFSMFPAPPHRRTAAVPQCRKKANGDRLSGDVVLCGSIGR
jgi:hypothetical protein